MGVPFAFAHDILIVILDFNFEFCVRFSLMPNILFFFLYAFSYSGFKIMRIIDCKLDLWIGKVGIYYMHEALMLN